MQSAKPGVNRLLALLLSFWSHVALPSAHVLVGNSSDAVDGPTSCALTLPAVSITPNQLNDVHGFLDKVMPSTKHAGVGDDKLRESMDKYGPRRKSMCQDDTYGELTPAGAQVLFKHPEFHLVPTDTFYDLGSGLGRLVMEAALVGDVSRAVGVELSEGRSRLACEGFANVVTELKGAVPPSSFTGAEISNIQGDITKVDVSSATAVYVCSLCFRPALLAELEKHLAAQLPRGARVASLKEFPGKVSKLRSNQRLLLKGTTDLEFSWGSKARVYLYKVQ